MKCKVEKSKLNGEIVCPANKSYTHRGVFLAALSDGKSIIKKILRSKDTKATIDACSAFARRAVRNRQNAPFAACYRCKSSVGLSIVKCYLARAPAPWPLP